MVGYLVVVCEEIGVCSVEGKRQCSTAECSGDKKREQEVGDCKYV